MPSLNLCTRPQVLNFLGTSNTIVELASYSAGMRLYLVHRDPRPKRADRQEVQLHEVPFSAVEIVMLGAINGLAPMLR